MISKLGVSSCKRTSKLRSGGPGEQHRFSRNSMLKIRLGAVPDTEVNTPCPPAISASYKSCQYGAIRSMTHPAGRGHPLAKSESLAPVNCRLPFEEITTEKKVWS